MSIKLEATTRCTYFPYRLDTTNACYYQAAGDISLLLRKPPEALVAYARAIQYDPGNAGFQKKRGEALLKLQQYKQE
jgi:predicted Zn-dependent protease